jgi:hypothetical protein
MSTSNSQANESAKKAQVMAFLRDRVFDPVLNSPTASASLKAGIRLTAARIDALDSFRSVQYVWSAIHGTDRSVSFARKMRQEGFSRFEENIEDFRNTFDDRWLRS